MRLVVTSGIALLGVALLSLIGLWIAGCSLYRPAPQSTATSASPITTATHSEVLSTMPAKGEEPVVVRVAGDPSNLAEFVDGEYRSGDCRITTPLPEGYPDPTPPGAIELKRYPLVRRAEVSGSMSPDWGMNFAFFPLFNHIKRREIAMTSPVEMNYEGLGNSGADKPSSWTMSFVYRSPDLGPAGVDPKDERILIEDIPPMSVLAIGMRGPYKADRVRTGVEALRAWLAQQSDWEESGEPRALFYNGPEARSEIKWSEVQIPLQRR